MIPPRSLISSVLILSLLATLFHGPLRHVAANNRNVDVAETTDDEKGLQFRLSNGVERPSPKKPTTASELSQSETENILKRLPPMKVDPSGVQEFALREGSPPPPRTGNTIETSFPAPSSAATDPVTAGPLEVLRYSPEGGVPIAAELTITFSQPMVALTSQDEAAGNVPVKLNPQPPGKWRWLGTKTLIFKPDDRFPMATTYVVTVPAGTRAANGSTLTTEKSWGFTTPPVSVKTTYPIKDGIQPRDTLIFIEFDQRINPVAVLPAIRVSSGEQIFKTRLATADEVKQAVARDPEGTAPLRAANDRLIAFRALDPKTDQALPANSRIKVSLISGTPSAEGPNLSQQSHDFWFSTYGPLKVTKQGCEQNLCKTDDSFEIEFNNDLAKDLDESKIKVEPALGEMETFIYQSSLSIDGRKRGNTTYRVTLDKSIEDKFHQTLGRDLTFTFKVGPGPRRIAGLDDDFVVMDPAAPARYSVFSTNYTKLTTRIYSVTPDDWPAWTNYQIDRETSKTKLTPPGRLVVSKTISIRNAASDIVETPIDLTPALTNGLGQMILIVEPSGGTPTENDGDPHMVETWIQVTNIGLDAFVDRTDLVGWVTSLKDGAPLSNVDLTIWPIGISTQSGPDGLARFPFKLANQFGRSYMVARRGGDAALLPNDSPVVFDPSESWVRKDKGDSLRWFVFDDRQMYQPGEEVHIKGWIRRVGADKTGDLGLLADGTTHVAYVLSDSRGNQMKIGGVALNAFGGFDCAFKLPDKLNLGYTSLKLQALTSLEGNTYQHYFQVQEFRRPEFEVKAQTESEGPFFVGAGADVSVSGTYYAGGGLANATVNWTVRASPTNYTPPNRGDYVFGQWVPWWSYGGYGQTTSQDLSGVTDAQGKHLLHIDFDRVNPARPSTVTASASIKDVNRQNWSSQTTLLVHPADLYVGLKTNNTFVQQGEPLRVDAIVTDLDGKLIDGREIKMVATRVSWKRENDDWVEVETDPQECSIRSSGSAVTCTFQPKEGGEYRVKASIHDDRERRNESELKIWVSGDKSPYGPSVEEEEVQLIPNRKDFKAGDTAEILVQAPFYPAEGVLTVRRSGILKLERFRMDTPTTTLRVPIEEGWTPNVHLQVDLLGETQREPGAKQLPTKPAYASGKLKLSIPPFDRRLSVSATPRDTGLEPGGETSVRVEVKDATGAPVSGSEVAVVVVDEAVLALTKYKLSDPVSVFYAEREAEVDDFHLRDSVRLSTLRPGVGIPARVAETLTTDRAVMANAAPMVSLGGYDAIRVRADLNPLAVFAPSIPTDVNGQAEVKVKLPDNLTRYRVMAVAVAGGKQFGSGESSITARIPLMVRPSAPRFLNFGDSFEFPVVVQNQTATAMSVDVALRAGNAVLSGANSISGRRVTVPANDRVEVRIPVKTATAGTARFQVAAVSGRWSDAAEISLPVWTPATTESFATYGEIDQGAISQPVKAPAEVFKEFGGLELEASSTQLQQLTDAFIYLQNYPYECSEQIASRILSIAALQDVLYAFNAKGVPSRREIEATVVRDISRLEAMQNEDGGFAFWKRGDKSWPFLTIHVGHAFARARQKGLPVPVILYDKTLEYLRHIESNIPSDYGLDARRALIAYALYVRAQMGDRDNSRARKLLSDTRVEDLSLETIGWLLFVLTGDDASRNEVETLRRSLQNRVTETAATAHFVCSYNDDDHHVLNSDRRADAIILEALIADQPANDLIPKIVRGLLDQRIQGRWSSTQENVFVLLALDRYFKTYEKVPPDFVARVWLGNAYAGEHSFKGRSVNRQKINVPMHYLTDGDAVQNLLISKAGDGRLYYRLAMNYAPVKLSLDSADYGFAVERTYEAIDDPEDVQRDPDGGWRVKAGVRVRVRVTMSAPSRRYHVALVDYLPAGFETLNPELAVTEQIPEDKKEESTSRRLWFDYQNLRNERSEAFTTLLWGGVYTYSYVVRATTPGQFIVPPAKAEEMYHPETFGRSKSDRVRVE